MKKKIAILITTLGGGGAERSVSTLLNALHESFEFHLFLLDTYIQYPLPESVKVHYLYKKDLTIGSLKKLFLMPILAFRYQKMLQKEDIAVSLSYLNRPNLINCLLRTCGFKGRILIAERTSITELYDQRKPIDKFFLALHKWLYPKADLILPNSWGVRHCLEKILGIKANYEVVYNAIDKERVLRLAAEETLIYDHFTFVSIGNFYPYKNHDLTIQAFAEWRKQGNEGTLVIIGGYFEAKTNELKTLTKSLDIEKNVIFAGVQTNPYRFLKNADVFVLASRFEGFPNVLLEALTCGLSVIASDCLSGPRELLASKTDYSDSLQEKISIAEYGILVRPNDSEALTVAMQRLSSDEGLRHEYRQKAANYASQFDVEKGIHSIGVATLMLWIRLEMQ